MRGIALSIGKYAPAFDSAGEGDAAGLVDFAQPVEAARAIVCARYTRDGLRTLHFWQGGFYLWVGANYATLPAADVREALYAIGPTCSEKPIRKATVDNVLDALKAAANLSHRLVPAVPAWIDATPVDDDPRALVPLRNGLLHVDRRDLQPPSPRFFSTYSLPFDYVEAAPAPAAWLAFLDSLWPGDQESIDCLQEWFGYLLTADTCQQKALLVVGPRRSGKGTIGRVIVQLLGAHNVASPTLASIGTNFGLQPLIGKTCALMSDARLGSKADIAAVAENLLRLTGEDQISVDRKFQEAYTARLLARVVVFANEVPTFRDAASALPSRFVVLRTTRSFYGREDHTLDRKLTAELAAIFRWSLDGLQRLRARGRFVQPASALADLRLMEELASPIGTFLRERCVVEPGACAPVQKMYETWRKWCEEHGRDQPGTEQTFGRDLAAAAPGLRMTRPRINGMRHRYYEGVRLRTPDDPDIDWDADEPV